MGIMDELLYAQNHIVEDIKSLFPSGVTIGVGISSFADSARGEAEAPVVMTRAIGIENNAEESNSLFNRIAYITTHISRDHYTYEMNDHPAIVYVIQDGRGKDCGVLVVTVEAKCFNAEDYNIDADDFMKDLYARIMAYAVHVSHTYGGVFF